MIEYFYGLNPILKPQIVVDILYAAQKYLVLPIADGCIQYMRLIQDSLLLNIISSKLQNYGMSDAFKDMIINNKMFATAVMLDETFLKLPRSIILNMLALETLQTSETIIYDQTLKWSKYQYMKDTAFKMQHEYQSHKQTIYDMITSDMNAYDIQVNDIIVEECIPIIIGEQTVFDTVDSSEISEISIDFPSLPVIIIQNESKINDDSNSTIVGLDSEDIHRNIKSKAVVIKISDAHSNNEKSSNILLSKMNETAILAEFLLVQTKTGLDLSQILIENTIDDQIASLLNKIKILNVQLTDVDHQMKKQSISVKSLNSTYLTLGEQQQNAITNDRFSIAANIAQAKNGIQKQLQCAQKLINNLKDQKSLLSQQIAEIQLQIDFFEDIFNMSIDEYLQLQILLKKKSHFGNIEGGWKAYMVYCACVHLLLCLHTISSLRKNSYLTFVSHSLIKHTLYAISMILVYYQRVIQLIFYYGTVINDANCVF